MANVSGMTWWGWEALFPTGYETADLVEDRWFDHLASLFGSASLSLPVLPVNGLGVKAFAFAHDIVGACLRVPVLVAHCARRSFDPR